MGGRWGDGAVFIAGLVGVHNKHKPLLTSTDCSGRNVPGRPLYSANWFPTMIENYHGILHSTWKYFPLSDILTISGRNCNVPKWSTFGLPFHVKLDGAGMVSSHWGGVVLYPTPSTGRCSTTFKNRGDI